MRNLVLSLLFVIMIFPQSAVAQCAMCRAVLETGGDNAVAEGINNGIVYLMAVPYLLVGGLFFFVYRKMKS
ncbi:hypothetical protein [Arenibacter certesii]|nr:hypothetical protein [Arenibacter certesii]